MKDKKLDSVKINENGVSTSKQMNGDTFFGCIAFDEFTIYKFVAGVLSKMEAIRAELPFPDLLSRQEMPKLSKESEQSDSQVVIEFYFEMMIDLLENFENANDRDESITQIYKKALEEMLLIGCNRNKSDNTYRITEQQPLLFMHRFIAKQIAKEVDKSEGSAVDIAILNEVIQNKNKNRYMCKIYGANQIYEATGIVDEQGLQIAKSFTQIENNTEIPAIRIWEKITNYIEQHGEKYQKESENRRIEIACFGQLENIEELQRLCAENEIEIDISHARQKREIDQYYFELNKDGQIEAYDLLSTEDLEELFENYHIVLFLDLNCFYSQYQEPKGILEKNAAVNCRWYMQQASSLKKFKDKAAYFQVIYDDIGRWLNSLGNDMSSRFEFDEKLFQTIQAVDKKSADVYLYIGYGDKIAGKNIHNNSICNDEYYGGKQLIVCKVASNQQADLGEYLEFLKRNEAYAVIDSWKLIKSISNSYYHDVLSDIDIIQAIKKIKETYCILDYRNIFSKNEKKELFYTFYDRTMSSEVDSGIIHIIQPIIDSVLKYALEATDFVCVRRYFRDLIVNSIISKADSVSGLMFAHLLSNNEFGELKCQYEKQLDILVRENILKQGFRIRKTIYSMIESLADLKLRSMDDRESYLINSFGKITYPEISEKVFKEALKKINECCEAFDYMDSRLYVNSKL